MYETWGSHTVATQQEACLPDVQELFAQCNRAGGNQHSPFSVSNSSISSTMTGSKPLVGPFTCVIPVYLNTTSPTSRGLTDFPSPLMDFGPSLHHNTAFEVDHRDSHRKDHVLCPENVIRREKGRFTVELKHSPASGHKCLRGHVSSLIHADTITKTNSSWHRRYNRGKQMLCSHCLSTRPSMFEAVSAGD